MTTQNYKEYEDGLDSIILLFEALQKECEAKGYPIESITPIQKVIGKIMMKIYKSSLAVRILCKQRFTEDCQPILRNLLELTIICRWLTLDNDLIKLRQLEKKMSTLAHKRLVQFKLLLEEKQKSDPDEETKNTLEVVIKDLRKFRPISDVPNCPELYEMASSIDASEKEYCNNMRKLHTAAYWILTQSVHFSFYSLENFYREEENFAGFVALPNFDMIPDIILHMGHISLMFLEIFNKTFKLGLDKRINEESERFIQLTIKHNESS